MQKVVLICNRLLFAFHQHHFEKLQRVGEEPKIVFFVPTVGLVAQQKLMFMQYLPSLKTLGLSGDQDSKKLPLRELTPKYDVLVMTPQIMQNSLLDRDVVSLGLYTLLIFDECHHTIKNHPYNGIMGHYIDEKFTAETAKRATHLPQVSV